MRTRCASACSVTRAASALLTLLLIVASTAPASEPKFPLLSGRVVDDAGVLNSSTVDELTLMLADHERTTGEQVVVVTLDSLQGYTIEDYGYQLGRHWGIGQKGVNTGAILIVAPREHKVRIEVGYGLEGTLTDATSRTIIENDILPNFKRGDFNAGVLAGTTSILKVLGANETTGAETEPGPAELGPTETSNVGLGLFTLFFLLALIALAMKILGGGRKDFIRRMGGVVGPGTNYGAGFGSGGGFGGGGGFSGGGGSFGGGGASGSW
jgi:uncharacterized protein